MNDAFSRFGDYQADDCEAFDGTAPRTDGSVIETRTHKPGNGWAWWVAAVLVAVGGALLIVSYEPATGLDSSITWSK